MITHEQIRRFHALYRQDRNAQALTAAICPRKRSKTQRRV